ncbi:lyase family protein, partial [Ligaoa zhengdingensis]
MALWAGRFKKAEDERVNDFNSSIRFDFRMYRYDIQGSIAHATMLARQGIIEQGECDRIIEGLNGILHDIESGALELDPAAEDVHMFVEAELTRRIGDAGKRLHTARSRNDQVALDIRMYLRDECDAVI